jgi:hypothetical protein
MYLDWNLDGDYDQEDKDACNTWFENTESWGGGNELTVIKAGFLCTAQEQAENAVTVWVDNLRVFRSAYALDLALGAQELNVASTDPQVTTLLGGNFSNIQGNMDNLASADNTGLNAIGFNWYDSAGGSAAFEHEDKDYVNADISGLAIGNYDHTNNLPGSNQSLKINLAGNDGDDGWSGALDAVRVQLFSSVVDGSGDGLYAIEAYVAKYESDSNSLEDNRDPQVRVLIQEVAPNYFGSAAGYICTFGGLPQTVTGDTPYNWLRCVAHIHIPNCTLLRGGFEIMDSFREDYTWFPTTIYIDDVKLYKVDDQASLFDPDLYDTI